MPLTSQSVGPKLAWVARHEPEVAAQTASWHTATSFIVERLSGVAAIDHHQASYFGPFIDVQRRAWDLRHADATERAALDGRLPERRWPHEIAGPITEAAARQTGLSVGVPVLVGTSDGPMEALAAGATQPGVVAMTHGSTTTLTTFARPARDTIGLWVTEGLSEDRPSVGAGLTTTGALLDWAGAILGLAIPEDEVDDLTRDAAASPPGAHGLLVVPSFAGEATPVDDPAVRGMIAGLTLSHTRGDLYRAVLEGIGFGIRQLLESFEAAGVPTDRLRAAGGGTRNHLAMQVVSDVTGRPQYLGAVPVGAALGAARLAAQAVGLAASDADWFVADRHVEPDPGTAATYDERYRWFRQLIHDTRPTMHALASAADR